MNTLDKTLNTLQAPAPSDLLKARILREAAAMRPAQTALPAANDNRWKKWSAVAAMALIMGFAGFSTLQNFNTDTDSVEAELLADAADELGYETLYAWVHYDDEVENTDTQESYDESALGTGTLPI
ncbi:hypothetical protein DES40_2477 [Litorimonas taeanensis]|uniref:DUF3619 family protein n=1 Tax=Litorimonas taeanensis TaxID=568099 RepID=A0A420WFC1_9PROT|nr:hypothetical protein [Litorimonas taeanensis]RKQ69673.1 hypothetical protein DES40_2477 [Litorimonas taeanensis]